MPWTDTQPGLPFTASATSQAGAKAGQPKAGSQAWRIYLSLRACPQTLHELSDQTGLPLNICCARVGWVKKAQLIYAHTTKVGPHGVPNTVWAVRR